MRAGVNRLLAALLALSLTLTAAAGVGEGYADALDALPQVDQIALFGEALAPVAERFGALDFDRMSDGEKLDLFNVLSRTGYPNLAGETSRPQMEVAGLLLEFFGTEVDFSSFQTDTPPTLAQRERGHLCSDNRVYFRTLRNLSKEVSPVTPRHLYALGRDRYAAVFTQKGAERWAVVERNGDHWRILRLFAGDTPPTAYQLAQYSRPSSWADGEVRSAQDEGLTAALDPDAGFQAAATRLQFAQLAVSLAQRLSGQELAVAAEATFSDCQDISARKAYQAGIVNGTAPGVFSPDGVLTREQLATMLWRVMERFSSAQDTPEARLSAYQDAAQISPWAREAVAALTSRGILKGDGAGNIAPKSPCTVEQAILLTYRVFSLLEK